MEQLPRLRAQIAALGDFHELIRALEALAATHYRAAQEALRVSARHLEIVEQAVRSVSVADPTWSRQQGPDPVPSSSVTIAICTEHGFVGAFNDHVLDRLEAEMSAGETLILLGRHGAQIASERSIQAQNNLHMAAHANSVPGLARQLLSGSAWASRIRVVFGRHGAGGHFSVDSRVIHIGPAPNERDVPELEWPLHHLTLESLRADLRKDLAFATISHCLLESLTSENATRLARMQSADRNVRDRLEQLKLRERTVRQQEITEELLDILAGVAAVST